MTPFTARPDLKQPVAKLICQIVDLKADRLSASALTASITFTTSPYRTDFRRFDKECLLDLVRILAEHALVLPGLEDLTKLVGQLFGVSDIAERFVVKRNLLCVLVYRNDQRQWVWLDVDVLLILWLGRNFGLEAARLKAA